MFFVMRVENGLPSNEMIKVFPVQRVFGSIWLLRFTGYGLTTIICFFEVEYSRDHLHRWWYSDGMYYHRFD